MHRDVQGGSEGTRLDDTLVFIWQSPRRYRERKVLPHASKLLFLAVLLVASPPPVHLDTVIRKDLHIGQRHLSIGVAEWSIRDADELTDLVRLVCDRVQIYLVG